jgi:hypothetical protein
MVGGLAPAEKELCEAIELRLEVDKALFEGNSLRKHSALRGAS